MPKEPTIKMTQRSRITNRYNAKGELIETHVANEVKGKPSSEKIKKQKIISLIQTWNDELKISTAFANELARMVLNWKPRRGAKHYVPKKFILDNGNGARFQKTFTTDLNRLELARYFFVNKLDYDIENRDKMYDAMLNNYIHLIWEYPKKVGAIPEDIRNMFKLSAANYRQWYIKLSGEPDWAIKKTNEEIKAIYEKVVSDGLTPEQPRIHPFLSYMLYHPSCSDAPDVI